MLERGEPKSQRGELFYRSEIPLSSGRADATVREVRTDKVPTQRGISRVNLLRYTDHTTLPVRMVLQSTTRLVPHHRDEITPQEPTNADESTLA
jgi:hypothetical protein